MPKPKDELLTKAAAGSKLKRDRHLIAELLQTIRPDDNTGRYPRWRRSTIEAALAKRADETQHHRRNDNNETSSPLTAARTMQAEERGRLLRLDRLEREGKLADVDEFTRDIESSIHATKTYLLGIPTSIVPELLLAIPGLSEQDRHQVAQAMADILDQHIRHAIGDLRVGKHLPPDEVTA